jgi:hypothetical protein
MADKSQKFDFTETIDVGGRTANVTLGCLEGERSDDA